MKKRILTLLLTVLMVLTLCACGGGDKGATGSPAPSEATDATKQEDTSSSGETASANKPADNDEDLTPVEPPLEDFEIGGWSIMAYDGKEKAIILPTESADGTTLTRIESLGANCAGTLEVLVVPEGYTLINTKAFQTAFTLREVHLPDSLEVIAPDAFTWSHAITIHHMGQTYECKGKASFKEVYEKINDYSK